MIPASPQHCPPPQLPTSPRPSRWDPAWSRLVTVRTFDGDRPARPGHRQVLTAAGLTPDGVILAVP